MSSLTITSSPAIKSSVASDIRISNFFFPRRSTTATEAVDVDTITRSPRHAPSVLVAYAHSPAITASFFAHAGFAHFAGVTS